MKYDLIVIGSGGAGLSAAIEANSLGKRVLIISKTYPTHSQTVQAQGGINAVIYENEDSVEKHIEETYNASKELSKFDNIKFMCENAKDTISWLDKLGVPFSREDNGNISQRPFGGTKFKRTCYSSDYTGLKILHTLYDTVIKNKIDILNEKILLDFDVTDNVLNSIVVLDIKTSKTESYQANAYILATGGTANCYYKHSTNTATTTGDGLAISFLNGLTLSNLEFMQFHPTALKGSNSLISESARAEGGYLITKDGERFVNELDTRDKVAREIKTKLLNHEEVFLDLRHIELSILIKKMPQEIKLIKDVLNLDVTKDLIPINPAAHYSMGGILTNVSCETSIKNLYVCGEVAQSNIHGANRLGGNSLLEIITFGRVAGRNSVKEKYDIKEINLEKEFQYKQEIEKLFKKEYKQNINLLKRKMGEIMFKKVGLFRDEENLSSAIDEIEELESNLANTGIKDKDRLYNTNLVEYYELKNLLLISKLITKSALNRKESRGSHYRNDYQETKDKYSKNSLVKYINKEIKISVEE